MFSLETLQKIAPWLAILAFWPKVLISILIIAFAFLCLLILWTPPLKDPKAIEPLDNPVPATGHSTATPSGLAVSAVYVDKSNSQRRLFDVLLKNPTSDSIILSKFVVKWTYLAGQFASIDQAESLSPSVKYSIHLPIDPDKSGEQNTKIVPIHPPLIFPKTTSESDSITNIRIEIYYDFESSRLDYHPYVGWDIPYEIYVVDDQGTNSLVLSGSWNH